MPITSGKNIGSQNVAKGGANLFDKTPALGLNVTTNTGILECPGLPKLTWIVTQTAGAASASVTPQVAIRRQDGGIAGALFEFVSISQPALLNVGGAPTVFEFNCPVQAIRLAITSAGVDALTTVTTIVAASA